MEAQYLLLGLAVLLTVGLSALCSVIEAMILSTKATDVESLRGSHPRLAERLDRFLHDLGGTTSAILSLNTIANTAGATICGGLAVKAFGEENFFLFSTFLVVAILIFAEVIPKNLGVHYRPALLPVLVPVLHGIRIVMKPVSYFCNGTVRVFLRHRAVVEDVDAEIILLAQKRANEGELSESEREMISNALNLDETPVGAIMTPRTVVVAVEARSTVGDVVREFANIPFARLPVYADNIDQIEGIVRRRDILGAKAENRDGVTMADLKTETVFIPETAMAADALQAFLKNHQQMAVVVDEYGSMAGVLSLEDVMETILGQEIFEHDDVAVDMRELARRKRRVKTARV